MSYKGSYLISKCELIPNGSSLEEGYDIVRGNPSINYYESITSPSISMTVSFFDTVSYTHLTLPPSDLV